MDLFAVSPIVLDHMEYTKPVSPATSLAISEQGVVAKLNRQTILDHPL